MKRVVVIGDSLIDRDIEGEVQRVCPDAPVPVLEERDVRSRPGGAALAAGLAARLAGPDMQVSLVTAIGRDGAGPELLQLIRQAGVDVVNIPTEGAPPEKVRLRAGGQSLIRLDRCAEAGRLGPFPGEASRVIGDSAAVLVADYGRGLAAHPQVREALGKAGRPVVWDPHPKGPDPLPGCQLVTPNAAELAGPGAQRDLATLTTRGHAALRRWKAAGVAVTRGSLGALLVTSDEPPLAVPAAGSFSGDACGAGDCFAASLAVRLARGSLPSEAVVAAVADAGRFVSEGAASGFSGASGSDGGLDAGTLAERVRRSGGTVVAAGGCFDLLHAGHVSLLQAARSLGDCLIVCLNSDRSVRRLKGPGRPINAEADRSETLSALACVDAVEIFDDDTPEEVIRRIRPDVWVKGGDYDAHRLPEAGLLAGWGGQAVVLPYLDGRSTTGMLEKAMSRPG